MIIRAVVLPVLAGLGLAGCIAYPAPVVDYAPAPQQVYVAPAPAVYVAPRPRRYWGPRRCDRWGRCWG